MLSLRSTSLFRFAPRKAAIRCQLNRFQYLSTATATTAQVAPIKPQTSGKQKLVSDLTTDSPLSTSTPAEADQPKLTTLSNLPTSPKVDKIMEDITSLNFIEIVQLVSKLKTKLNVPQGFNLSSMRSLGGGGGPAAAATPEEAKPKAAEPAQKPAQTSFDVKLEGFEAADKIKVIKEVRTITGLGLKEAKELVESAPKVIASGLGKSDADAMLEKLKAAGAKISLV